MDSDLRRIISVPRFDELLQRRQYIEPAASAPSDPNSGYAQQLADVVTEAASSMESFLIEWADVLSKAFPADALVDYVVADQLSSIASWEKYATDFLESLDQENYDAGVAYIGAAGLLRDMTETLSYFVDSMVGSSASFRADVKTALRQMDGSAALLYRRAAADVGRAIENSWLGMDISPLDSSVATLVNNTMYQIANTWNEMRQRLFGFESAPKTNIIDAKSRFILIEWIRSVSLDRLRKVIGVLHALRRLIEVLMALRAFQIVRVRVDWDTLVKDYLIEPMARQLRAQTVRFVTSKIIPILSRLLDVADDLEAIAERIPGDEPDRSIGEVITILRGYIEQAKVYTRHADIEQSKRNVLALKFVETGAEVSKLRAARDSIRVIIQFLEENAHYAQP